MISDIVKVCVPGIISKQIFRIDSGREVNYTAIEHTTEVMGKEWTTVMVNDVAADVFWDTYFPSNHLVRTAYTI